MFEIFVLLKKLCLYTSLSYSERMGACNRETTDLMLIVVRRVVFILLSAQLAAVLSLFLFVVEIDASDTETTTDHQKHQKT